MTKVTVNSNRNSCVSIRKSNPNIIGAVILKGNWDPSGGTLPGIGKQGWLYKASANGTVGGFDINQGMQILFLTDDPGQTLSNYDIR